MGRRFVALLLFLAMLVAPGGAHAWEPPKLTGAVVDTSGKLSQAQRAALEQRLGEYRTRTTNEVVVFLIASLAGESVEDVAYKSFNTWGIGKKGKDNGVLLVLAPAEHRMRIETGKGVGDRLTDLESSHILRDRVGPLLKKDDYVGAINAGIDAITSALDGPSPTPSATTSGNLGWLRAPVPTATATATATATGPRYREDDAPPVVLRPESSWYEGISWFFVVLVGGLLASLGIAVWLIVRKNRPFEHSGLAEWTPGGPNIEPSTTTTPYEPPTTTSFNAPSPTIDTSTSIGTSSTDTYTGGGGTSGGGGSSDSW